MAKEAFDKLPPDRRREIERECMREFVEYGYAQASTNRIVQRLGISKGSLFYYFGGKRELYLHLLRNTLDLYIAEITAGMSEWPKELVARLRGMVALGMDLFEQRPLEYRFVMTFIDGGMDDIRSEWLAENFGDSIALLQGWLTDADFSRVQGDVTAAIRLIGWVFVGIKVEIAARIDRDVELETLRTEMLGLLDEAAPFLRRALYAEKDREDD
jgi:AcrR family transcriptional regulator